MCLEYAYSQLRQQILKSLHRLKLLESDFSGEQGLCSGPDSIPGPGARFSKVPELYGPFPDVTIPLYHKNGEDLSRQTSQSVCFLLP